LKDSRYLERSGPSTWRRGQMAGKRMLQEKLRWPSRNKPDSNMCSRTRRIGRSTKYLRGRGRAEQGFWSRGQSRGKAEAEQGQGRQGAGVGGEGRVARAHEAALVMGQAAHVLVQDLQALPPAHGCSRGRHPVHPCSTPCPPTHAAPPPQQCPWPTPSLHTLRPPPPPPLRPPLLLIQSRGCARQGAAGMCSSQRRMRWSVRRCAPALHPHTRTQLHCQ